MTIYVVAFVPFGKGNAIVDSVAFLKRKDAEREAKELRANGHKNVVVTPVTVR